MTSANLLRLARSRLVAPTLPQIWSIVCVAGVFVISSLTLLRPHDFWWHVRAGQWIVDNGRVPTSDLFSFTRVGEPWAYQSWLMEVILFLLLRAGDEPLVIFFHALVITAAYALLFGVNRRAANGDTRWAALATVAAAAVGLGNWNVRPQSVSILLFGLTLYFIERHEWRQSAQRSDPQRDWALWGLPAVFALWANSHGAIVFGLLLLGTYLLAQLLAWLRRQNAFPRQVFLVTVFSAASTLLTPLGLGIIDYFLGFLRHPVTRALNVEFMPPTVRALDGQAFFVFVATFVALLLVSGYRPSPRESLRLLLFGALALMARRNTIWFGFVAAPTMAAALQHWTIKRAISQGRHTGRPRVNLVIVALVGLLVLLSLPWLRLYLPLPGGRRTYVHPETPVQAVDALRKLPEPGRVFHNEAYGSYMIWASPEVPVFIDTRIELYPEEQWQDYVALLRARYDWEAILEHYGVDTLLLDWETQEMLIEAVGAAPDWVRVYQDGEAVIYRQRGEP